MIPVIFGCAGPVLTASERDFFRAVRPLGFILFGRNCIDPAQIRALVTALRNSALAPDAPVLVDQEGGRVARLRPPHWRHPPPAARFGELYRRDAPAALDAARLNAQLIGLDLAGLGVDTVCAPVLDIPVPGSHDIVGDRAFGEGPDSVIALAQATILGFEDAGVAPILKHMPGHGRAQADSHEHLPIVDAPVAALAALDWRPFAALRWMAPWAMTAHVVYSALDPAAPATTSALIVREVMRRAIGFHGLIMTDDLSMKALSGDFAARTAASLAAGCDVVLHCNGDAAEMRAIADAAGAAGAGLAERLVALTGFRRKRAVTVDAAAARARLAALLPGA